MNVHQFNVLVVIRYGLVALLLSMILPSCGPEDDTHSDTGDTDSDTDTDTDSDSDTDTDSDSDTDSDTDTDSDSDTGTGSDTGEDTGIDTGDDPEGSWRFVVFCDSRGGNNGVNLPVLSSLVSATIAEEAEFVLFPGDLTTDGEQTQFESWVDAVWPLYDAQIPIYFVRGNHDDDSTTLWNNVFTGDFANPDNGPPAEKNLTFSGTHKNVFFAGMDVYTNSHRVNQDWLDAELAQNTEPHVFLFAHEPAFAEDHSDTLDDYADDRDIFWQSIKDAGGRVYFSGHDHFYSRASIDDGDGNPDNDIHQYIIGTAGAPFYNFDGNFVGDNGDYIPFQEYFSKNWGYVKVVINDLDVTLTFKEWSGSGYIPVDTFSYTAQQ